MKQQKKATGDDCPECLQGYDGERERKPATRPLVFVPGDCQTWDDPGGGDVMWCGFCGCEWPVDVDREFPPEKCDGETQALLIGCAVSVVVLILILVCGP